MAWGSLNAQSIRQRPNSELPRKISKINRLSYLKLFSPGAQEYYMSMSHVRWAFSPKLFSFL